MTFAINMIKMHKMHKMYFTLRTMVVLVPCVCKKSIYAKGGVALQLLMAVF